MKSCFIIMPIADMPGYPTGHFFRVYEHIIKPACQAAGFDPLRADDVAATNHIALDILKKVIESDMAICDLSGRNPNVLYELGIRQAFNKPVTLLKDGVTERIFDIQGLRDVSYDETLRVDNVDIAISDLSDAITATYEGRDKEINSLVSLLSIDAAELKSVQITQDTDIILKSITSLGDRLLSVEKLLSPMQVSVVDKHTTSQFPPGYTLIQPTDTISIGDVVWHTKFGSGTVKSLEGTVKNPIVTVVFASEGPKKLMRNYAILYKLSATELSKN